MALVDIDVYHAYHSDTPDDPAKEVSSDEWNHHHRVEEGSIPLAALSASAQAGAVRTTAVYTTASLANGASETGTLTMAKGYRLLHIQTSRAARVRFYVSSDQRTADLSRAAGYLPTGNHGLVAEFITTASILDIDCCPVVDGFSANGNIPINITNNGTSGTVELTATYAPTEV